MDNEQQIVEDILDSIYGVNVAFKGDDEKTVALRNEKRNEKRTELLIQIDSICNAIAKELETALGIKGIDIKKDIKPSVLVTLKAEAENKNIIMDSNGKINTGKFLDIVNQSKDEILEVIENGMGIEASVYQEDTRIENQANETFEKFFGDLSDSGLDLTEDERKEMQKIINEVNAILSEIQQSIDSGMTLEDAWDKKRKEVGDEEFKRITEKFKLVGKSICLTNREETKDAEQEHNSTTASADEPSKTPSREEPARSESTQKNGRTYIENKKEASIVDKAQLFAASYLWLGKEGNGNAIVDFPYETQYDKKDSYFWKKQGTGLGEKVDGLVSDEEARTLMQDVLTQRKQVPYLDITDEGQPQILKQGIPKQEIFQGLIEDTTLFNSPYQGGCEYGVIKDFQMADFLLRNGDELIADLFDLTRTEEPALTMPTHEQRHPVIGLEEVTVDEATVTQGESLEEPSTNRTINGDTLTSLVEGQGTVRDILDANGMVQVLTSPEKPLESSLETPTEGKKDTQSAPVADNGDKGEDGPGEL